MLKRILAIIIIFTLHNTMVKAADNMPIIAYMGVPNDKSTDTNFKDFRDCGFNVSLYGYESLKQLINACRVADKYGIKILGHCPETHNRPEYAAKLLLKEKGFFGYVLEDEPSAPRIRELQGEIKRLKSVDKSHHFYINLNPYYADWIFDIIKTNTYKEYLKVASATDCQQISFDHYPIVKQGLRNQWFYNLEMIREESLSSGKPFWGFILSVPHVDYPQPTMASLRLQAYVNLAYGAQAIQYFTYWTPTPTKEWDFHNAPISIAGKKTPTYYLVQNMNKELRPVADLFYIAKVTSVNHIGHIPAHTNKLKYVPTNISSIKVDGEKGAIVSQFSKNGNLYLAVVNKDHQAPMALYIKAKPIVVRLKKDLTTEKSKEKYDVAAGDIILFKLK